jgi:hypothetical protein
VFGKIITIAAAGVVICGAAFMPPAPAAMPQVESRQDPAQKEMQDRMTR